MTERVEIAKLPTGITGFDEALGGGIPEFSFNLIAGGPGAGKTTLAHQIMFAVVFAQTRNGTRKSQGGGLGMGLTIASTLVKLHGGRLLAHSSGPHTGATFVVELPLAK